MKKITIFTIIGIFLSVMAYAAVVSVVDLSIPRISPYYFIVGGTVNTANVTSFYVNYTPNSTTVDKLNCTLWTNDTGTWDALKTNNSFDGSGGISLSGFKVGSFAALQASDGLVFSWNAYCCDNQTCNWASANKTIFVQDAPAITLTTPAASGKSNTTNVVFNLTVTGDDDAYTCYFYMNSSGAWNQVGSFTVVDNATAMITQRKLNESSGVKYNVKCFERQYIQNVYGWASSNLTFIVDETDPVIVLNSPLDDAYFRFNRTKQNYSWILNYNVTDITPHKCYIYVNDTLNHTDTTPTSGANTLVYANASDGYYEWYVKCDDNTGNEYTTGTETFYVDSTPPTINRRVNHSSSGTCKGWDFEFNFSEPVNLTMRYGTAAGSTQHVVSETDFAINQTILLTHNNSYDLMHYANITFCDKAGNCNSSTSQMKVISPVGICPGWSLWSVHDTAKNFSDLATESHADYLYMWNKSSQSWAYYSAASTGHGPVSVAKQAIWFYSTDGETWKRTITNPGKYHYNISVGDNFFPLFYNYTFGQISVRQFRNITSVAAGGIGGNVTSMTNTYGVGGLPFNFDTFASYNNTAQTWVSHIYTWDWNNGTAIGPNMKGMDVLWTYSNFKVSVNMSGPTTGFIFGNWS